jgi:hypothetical protein
MAKKKKKKKKTREIEHQKKTTSKWPLAIPHNSRSVDVLAYLLIIM